MARIRSLKPSFFKNESLAELSPWHRLCYEGLWCWADREGRLDDRPRRLKVEIFPYDDVDMDALLSGLAAAGFIVRYEVNGRRCIAIPTFTEHQIPKKDERASVVPAPPDAVPPLNSSGTAAVPPTAPRVGRYEGRTEDSETEDRGLELPIASPRAEEVQALWNATTTPPIPRCRDLTAKRRRHVAARLRERPFEEWAEVFRRIQASAFCRGDLPVRDRGSPWVASFDWIIESPDSAVKVLEGKYDDRATGPIMMERQPWECPHVERCSSRSVCQNATILGRPVKVAS